MLRLVLLPILAGSLMHKVANACEIDSDIVLEEFGNPLRSHASNAVGNTTFDGARRQLQAPATRTYAIKSGDTIANIAGNFGIPTLATRKDKQRLKLLVGTTLTVPLPAEDDSSTTGGVLGPLNCSNDQVMVSCSTDRTCQSLGIPDFGCIDEPVCIQLFNMCKAQNPNCPSCCIRCKGKNPESNSNQAVGYYLMTFEDGSAHCDPWGWWR